jgi:phosphate-selective porin OprO/OprP
MKKNNIKQLVLVAAAGAHLTLPVLAADNAATSTNGAAQVEIPAIAGGSSGGNPSEAAEIKALKQQVEALVQKVNALEKQHGSVEQASTIQDLDQKVRILERQREIDQDLAAAKATNAPRVTLGANGFSFASADTNFVTQLHGIIQLDSRTFFNDNDAKGVDGFLLRRARPIFSGTVFRDFDYNFTPDFGGSTVQIPDAYLTYRYAPEFQVQVGKFKSPIGLEHLQSDRDISFNERSLATDLLPNRDLGIQVKGDINGGAVGYALAVLNGATDYNGTTTNTYSQNDPAFVARLFFQPWKNSDVNALRGFGFGVGGSYEIDNPNTNSATGLTPGYTTDGQQKFFAYNKGVVADGKHWRISPQASYYYGPFGLLGEYVATGQRITNGKNSTDVNNNAWEVSGSWLLTGEDATYTAITPRHNFDPRNNQWGAWQLVARYAELNVDSDVYTSGLADPKKSADGAQAWAVGLNWYLNKNIRADLSFSHTTFNGYTGGKPASGTLVVPAQDENVLFTRIQLAF